MKIQYKLSLTFILLLIFGVTAISSYSIVFIRGYLLSEAVENMEADARQIMLTFSTASGSESQLRSIQENLRSDQRYRVLLFDQMGNTPDGDNPFESGDFSSPFSIQIQEKLLSGGRESLEIINERQLDSIYIYSLIAMDDGAIYFAEISRPKSEIFKPIRTIRWIIYSGMFISIAIILFVSFIFSQYLSRPIVQIIDSSRKIADGDTNHKLEVNRSDEFGTLASSINEMSAKLQAENQKLADINEKQKQMLADIAHEIRNPVHTLMGTMEILEMDGLSAEKKQRCIQTAKNQAARINTLFNDLMTLQRSELEAKFIEMKSFDFFELAKKAEQNVQHLLQNHDLTFIVKGKSQQVMGDPNKLIQVIDNLISNAIKYTPEGRVALEWTKKGDHVEIKITDSGIGIAQEHIPRIFDRFYRTDKARSRDSGGLGLGLSVVKTILDAHKAPFEVSSSVGEGTVVTFYLKSA